MESIIDILHKGGYSCVMKNREEVRTFTQRGVADLYDLSALLRWHCCAKQELKRLLPKRFPISLTVTRPAGARWRRLAWS